MKVQRLLSVSIVDDMPVTAMGKVYKPAPRNCAIEAVVSERMREEGEARAKGLRAYCDQASDHVTAVSLADPAQLDLAREHLEKYPVVTEFPWE